MNPIETQVEKEPSEAFFPPTDKLRCPNFLHGDSLTRENILLVPKGSEVAVMWKRITAKRVTPQVTCGSFIEITQETEPKERPVVSVKDSSGVVKLDLSSVEVFKIVTLEEYTTITNPGESEETDEKPQQAYLPKRRATPKSKVITSAPTKRKLPAKQAIDPDRKTAVSSPEPTQTHATKVIPSPFTKGLSGSITFYDREFGIGEFTEKEGENIPFQYKDRTFRRLTPHQYKHAQTLINERDGLLSILPEVSRFLDSTTQQELSKCRYEITLKNRTKAIANGMKFEGSALTYTHNAYPKEIPLNQIASIKRVIG